MAGIYDYRHGVRIPAAGGGTYSVTPTAHVLSSAGGLLVFSEDSSIHVQSVLQLPVPEKARIRQFVMVGHVAKGVVLANLGSVYWNVPRQYTNYATLYLRPTTPYEIPDRKQQKVVAELPESGTGSLATDRIRCYFIEAQFRSDTSLSIEEALELFYFELYWD